MGSLSSTGSYLSSIDIDLGPEPSCLLGEAIIDLRAANLTGLPEKTVAGVIGSTGGFSSN